jgi:fucose permease
MSTLTTTPPAKGLVTGTIFAHLDFVLTGVVMTLLGPLLPLLSVRWGLNDTRAGYLFLAQFVASVVGMLTSGPLVRRYGYRVTLLIGLAFMTIGVALLAGADSLLGTISICLFGTGFGITTPAGNLFVGDAKPQSRAASLSLVNSSWGVGAMCGPLINAAVQRVHHTAIFLYVLAASLVLLAIALFQVRFIADQRRRPASSEPVVAGKLNWSLIVLVGAMFFLYVGTENAVGGWLASYAHRISPAATFWATVPAFFYGPMLVGRTLAPLLLRRVREVKVAAAGAVLALMGTATLLSSHSISTIVLGGILAGLGLSAVFPIKVSLLPHWFGDSVTRLSGPMFALGNFGGGALPWLVGTLSTHFSSLRIGFAVPLVGAASLLVFYLSQMRAHRPPLTN